MRQGSQAVVPPSASSRAAAPDEGDGLDSLYARGVALWSSGRRREAIAALDAALKRNPDFPDALCMGGYILAESGKREAALAFYRRALGFNVDLPAAWSNIGKLMFEDERYLEALDAFDAALAPLIEGDPDLTGIVRFERKRWGRPRHWQSRLGRRRR